MHTDLCVLCGEGEGEGGTFRFDDNKSQKYSSLNVNMGINPNTSFAYQTLKMMRTNAFQQAWKGSNSVLSPLAHTRNSHF